MVACKPAGCLAVLGECTQGESARRVGGSKKMEEFEVMEGQECRALHILSWCLSNANIESEPGGVVGGVVGLSGSGKRI